MNSDIKKVLKIESITALDEKKHMVDVVAKQYLQQAASDVRHLVPVKTTADGNCLYDSIRLLMNNPAVTTSELRGI